MSERARRKQADAARERIAHYNAVRLGGGKPDLEDVRALTDSDDPDIVKQAAFLLLLTVAPRSHEAFEAETPRLIRIARGEILPPPISASLLASLVWTRCLYMFRDAQRTQRQPDPALLAETADLAELSHARSPGSYRTRKALAFVRCIQDRGRDARDLLIAAPLEQLEPTLQADILTVRTLAELQLRDIAQARRLTNLARDYGHLKGLLAALESAVAAAERTSDAEAPEQGQGRGV